MPATTVLGARDTAENRVPELAHEIYFSWGDKQHIDKYLACQEVIGKNKARWGGQRTTEGT